MKNLVSLMQTGKYSDILQANLSNILGETSQFCRKALETNIITFLNSNDSSQSRYLEMLKTRAKLLMNALISLFQIFCVGVSSLQLFVQSNWLGCHSQYFDSSLPLELITNELVLDGECLIPTVKNLPCLLIAKTILHDLKHTFKSFKVY